MILPVCMVQCMEKVTKIPFHSISVDSHDALTGNGYHSTVSGIVHIAILDILILNLTSVYFSVLHSVYTLVCSCTWCTTINNNACKMVAVPRCRSQSNSWCRPCMKNGRSIPFSYLPASICPCAWCRKISWHRTIAPTWPTTEQFMRWDEPLTSLLSEPTNILKRSPRLSRVTSARKLAAIVQQLFHS